MTIKTTITCPLGSQCEQIVSETLHRCAWLVTLAGTNPTTSDTASGSKTSTSASISHFTTPSAVASKSEPLRLPDPIDPLPKIVIDKLTKVQLDEAKAKRDEIARMLTTLG